LLLCVLLCVLLFLPEHDAREVLPLLELSIRACLVPSVHLHLPLLLLVVVVVLAQVMAYTS
jgi:hypothetical protein